MAQLIMSELTPLVDAQHGAFFMMDAEPEPALHLIASYGFGGRKTLGRTSGGGACLGGPARERSERHREIGRRGSGHAWAGTRPALALSTRCEGSTS